MVDPRDILILQIILAPLYAFLVPISNNSALDCITLESHVNSAYLMLFRFTQNLVCSSEVENTPSRRCSSLWNLISKAARHELISLDHKQTENLYT